MLSSPKVQHGLLGVLVALLAAIAVLLVLGRVGGGSGARQGTDAAATDTAFDGNTLPDVRAANFSLTDQSGRRITLAHDRGHVVVLEWIHSLCRNECPYMTEQIKGALNTLPGRGRSVRVIGVSVEPGQDTPARRRHFLAVHEMTGRMQYVNGPMPVMRRVWKDYGIQPVTPKADHSAFVYVISKGGYERVGFPAVQLTPSALAHDIRRLQTQAG